MGRNGHKDVGQTKHGQSNLLDSVNVFSTLLCGQHHVAGGSTLDSVLAEGTETATLAWLVSALEHAIIRGQTKLVGYLEAVVEDVVFEMEAAARRRGQM